MGNEVRETGDLTIWFASLVTRLSVNTFLEGEGKKNKTYQIDKERMDSNSDK